MGELLSASYIAIRAITSLLSLYLTTEASLIFRVRQSISCHVTHKFGEILLVKNAASLRLLSCSGCQTK